MTTTAHIDHAAASGGGRPSSPPAQLRAAQAETLDAPRLRYSLLARALFTATVVIPLAILPTPVPIRARRLACRLVRFGTYPPAIGARDSSQPVSRTTTAVSRPGDALAGAEAGGQSPICWPPAGAGG